MLKERRLPTLIALMLWLAASVDAMALGFGRAPQAAVLGQPLDFAVALRLDAGESLSAECVDAEVLVGDSRLAPALVFTSIEPAGTEAATVRVTTLPALDEPVIAVTVRAGCTSRVTRRFLLLADPPASLRAPALQGAPLLLAEAAGAEPMSVNGSDIRDPGRVLVAAATPPAATTGPAPVEPVTGPTPAKPGNGLTPGKPANGLTPPKPAVGPAAAGRPRSDTTMPGQAAKPASAAKVQRPPAPKPTPSPAARLQLDVVEPVTATPMRAPPALGSLPGVDKPTSTGLESAPAAEAVIEEAIAVVAEAASSARASAQRISALEQDVQALRAQAQAGRDEALRWRAQADAANAAQRSVGPLWGAVLLLAGMCAWLAWRMRTLRRADQRRWLDAAAASAAAAAAAPPVLERASALSWVDSGIEPPSPAARPAWPAPVPLPLLEPAPTVQPAAPLPPVSLPAAKTAAALAGMDSGDPSPAERTEVVAAQPRLGEGAARDVSIEELIDLEQQAEFFVALGQDDAAIELLVEHLRSTGGGSPLPYLKLLEIYRRRDEPQAYERTRERFNDRFNAYAPDWASDLQTGRALEEYPGILPRLQQAWPRPLDAMAELEALLFRKSRGELFELPAYHEVLFLYALARDLLERESAESSPVDILLPLAEVPADSAPLPLAASSADATGAGRPTEPVELDLDLDLGAAPAAGRTPDEPAAGGRLST